MKRITLRLLLTVLLKSNDGEPSSTHTCVCLFLRRIVLRQETPRPTNNIRNTILVIYSTEDKTVLTDIKAVLPEIPDVGILFLVVKGVGEIELFHCPGQGVAQGRLEEKMHVIGHERVMIKLERMKGLNVGEDLEILPVILILMEDVHPVVSPGDYMKDTFFWNQSSAAWHNTVSLPNEQG